MSKVLQVEELGLTTLNSSEMILTDGGDSVNMCYHNGDSQQDWSRLAAIADGAANFLAGLTSVF